MAKAKTGKTATGVGGTIVSKGSPSGAKGAVVSTNSPTVAKDTAANENMKTIRSGQARNSSSVPLGSSPNGSGFRGNITSIPSKSSNPEKKATPKKRNVIKESLSPTKPSIDTKYRPSEYEGLNKDVNIMTRQNFNKANKDANKAYKMATKENNKNYTEAKASNTALTRQVGKEMKRKNFSLTNRNIASAASARSASTQAVAYATAGRNAIATRVKTKAKAKENVYRTKASLQSSNTVRDIERSTQLAKIKSERKFQSTEAQKNRDLKDAITKKQKAYDKSQRELSSYSKTLEARYSSVKAIDKAIDKMKASNDKQKSQKLAYLRALKVKIQEEKKKQQKAGGRGGRGYGRRGWGSSGGGFQETIEDQDNGKEEWKPEKITSKEFNLERAYQYARGSEAGKKATGEEMTLMSPYNIVKDNKKIAESRKKWKNKAKSYSTSVRWRGSNIRKK